MILAWVGVILVIYGARAVRHSCSRCSALVELQVVQLDLPDVRRGHIIHVLTTLLPFIQLGPMLHIILTPIRNQIRDPQHFRAALHIRRRPHFRLILHCYLVLVELLRFAAAFAGV